MNLYQEELLDHYRNPRHRGTLKHPDFSSDEFNPSCGDRVAFQGVFKEGILTDVAFTGSGCVISQAVASMLAQKACGLSIEDILAFDVETVQTLVGMPLGPNRLQCALLPLQALAQGVEMYKSKKESGA